MKHNKAMTFRSAPLRTIGALFVGAAMSLLSIGACTDDQTVVQEADCLSATKCGNICVDTNFDPDNCGSCFNECNAGEVCTFGGCRRDCGGGTDQCGDLCKDLQVDPSNCGACGEVCQEGQVCSAGNCTTQCGPGTAKCGDICADTMINTLHCGGCDMPCGPGELCLAGSCSLACGGSGVDCGGICTDPNTDPQHCGGCNAPCATDELCVNGSCDLVCLGGTSICGTTCVDILVDPSHCGGCDAPCAAGEVCNAGTCDLSCGGGTTECGASCIDADIDNAHCGGCDSPCNAGENCAAGVCQPIVDCNGATNCAGTCVNTQIDADNCGGCGVMCGVGSYCSVSNCVSTAGACSLLNETFGGTPVGWTLDAEWAIGSATGTSNTTCGGIDPGFDHTPNNDNGVAGVAIGGEAMQALHGFYYLTSPVVNTLSAPNAVLLRYWRWLVSDANPNMDNTVEVFDGTAWQTIYQSGAVTDANWTQQVFDVGAYKNAVMQVRFGFQVGDASVLACPSWNIDDVEIVVPNCN